MTELSTATRQAAKAALREQRIETPSWGYANSGTRFKVFTQEGVPRTPYEKIDDAAMVHHLTGAIVGERMSVDRPRQRGERRGAGVGFFPQVDYDAAGGVGQ